MKKVLLVVLYLCNLSAFCQKGTFTDHRDGKIYKTIQIGKQVWMAENIAFQVENNFWIYDDESDSLINNSYFYNWETAKKVCPTGWHLPTHAEFETLVNMLGPDNEKACYSLIKGGNSGFSALSTGWCFSNGDFIDVGSCSFFWSSSPDDQENAFILNIDFSGFDARVAISIISNGLSVRCLKDN
jgi:uncharacterized protein (TIGR02145 family)